MPKIPRNRLDEASDYPQLEKLKSRAKRHSVKIEKATEAMVESLSAQAENLAHEKMILHKLLRSVYRILTPDQQAKYNELKSDILAESEIGGDGV